MHGESSLCNVNYKFLPRMTASSCKDCSRLLHLDIRLSTSHGRYTLGRRLRLISHSVMCGSPAAVQHVLGICRSRRGSGFRLRTRSYRTWRCSNSLVRDTRHMCCVDPPLPPVALLHYVFRRLFFATAELMVLWNVLP